MQRKERIRLFVREIWSWFESHKRTLPWRDLPDTDLTGRAYKILVSEIMLQQTQVPRVIITFKNFLERFPTLRDLAGASNKEVL
ncbi:MAG: A/G-specific adenine glycosylase, partial [Candidatus Peribacteraceae bacterium]|nr:A/G-specific adenine glycosylase [Candidatus Peribacteraceae bacterium]